MIQQVLKRDGNTQDYDRKKIANAIFKAAVACGGNDKQTAIKLSEQVEELLNKKICWQNTNC